MSPEFPTDILRSALWDFYRQSVYSSQTAFEEAVCQHHRDAQEYAPEIRPEECWQPTAVVLKSPTVLIRFFSEPSGEEMWHEVELASDNGKWFTAGELLYKLHNRAIERITHNSHRWFEGFELESVGDSGIPVYSLVLGS